MVEHFSAGIERLETGEEETKRNRSGIDTHTQKVVVEKNGPHL
jgi:hypothetical protein